MHKQKIWDFYADWYEKLWVQKYVLEPSRNLIVENIDYLATSFRILDVGCGIGQLCADLNKAFPNAEIVGIDPSEKMIERARKINYNKNIKYITGFAENILFEEKFDVIVSTNAFPYVLDKTYFLEKIKKTLNPNGKLLLLFANRNTLYDFLILLIVKLTTSKADYLSVNSTSKLLQQCGYKIKNIKRINSIKLIPSVYMFESFK